MKLSVSTYSFHDYLKRDTRGPFAAVDYAALLGIEGMDFTDIFTDRKDPLSFAKTIGDYAREHGVSPACFCVHLDFLNGSGGDTEAELERGYRCVDLAAALGVPVMRHDVVGFMNGFRGIGSYEKAIPKLCGSIRKLTAYAKEKQIKTCTENHGFFSQDAFRVEALINEVGDPNFGMLVDLGNFLCADEDPAVSVGRCAQYAFHVHAKDFYYRSGTLEKPGTGYFMTRAGNYLKGTIIGHGVVPLKQCLETLKRNEYDGFVAIEFEGMEDPLEAIRIGAQNLRRLLP